jgi:hypothetical protein
MFVDVWQPAAESSVHFALVSLILKCGIGFVEKKESLILLIKLFSLLELNLSSI